MCFHDIQFYFIIRLGEHRFLAGVNCSVNEYRVAVYAKGISDDLIVFLAQHYNDHDKALGYKTTYLERLMGMRKQVSNI